MWQSAWTLTHGKEAKFAECLEFDTWKNRNVCRVPEIWHSANAPWPSPLRHVTFFRRASVSALGKVFVECPIENTRQRAVCRYCRWRVQFAECCTRQILCRVFFGLCRVPVAHGKATVSGSGYVEISVQWKTEYLTIQRHIWVLFIVACVVVACASWKYSWFCFYQLATSCWSNILYVNVGHSNSEARNLWNFSEKSLAFGRFVCSPCKYFTLRHMHALLFILES